MFIVCRFKLIKEKVVEFNQLAMQVAGSTSSGDTGGKSGVGNLSGGNASHSDNEGGGRSGEGMSSSADAKRPLIDRVSLRDNVALIAVLELKDDSAFKRVHVIVQ